MGLAGGGGWGAVVDPLDCCSPFSWKVGVVVVARQHGAFVLFTPLWEEVVSGLLAIWWKCPSVALLTAVNLVVISCVFVLVPTCAYNLSFINLFVSLQTL